MPDALSIGLSALQAQQRAMEVTSHNIANMATPGYSRQVVGLTTNVPEESRPGQVGRGVRVESIRRNVDTLLTEQLRKNSTETGRLDFLRQTMEAVQGVFNEPSEAGLASAVNKVFNALQALSNNPESPGVRGTAVNEMVSFTSTVNSMGVRLEEIRTDLRGQIDLQVNKINGLTDQIADLNSQIRDEVVVGNNPNDLMDRRESLINELSGLLDLRVRYDANTQAALIQIGGRLIVDSSQAITVRSGSSNDRIGLLVGDTGETLTVVGGMVGALIETAEDRVPEVINKLDGFVVSMVNEFNQLHAVGTNGDFQIDEYLSQTVITSSGYTVNLDDDSQVLNSNGAGIAAAFLPSFTDDDGVSQVRNLTINVYDTNTGIAMKSIVRYDPGLAFPPAGRSLKDLVDAINTGTGGGFTVYSPQGVGLPIANLTATAIPVSGGLRLSLAADDDFTVDFSRSLDNRPSSEAWNAATWTVGSPTVDLRGRYTGGVGFDPAQPWTMQVLSGGTIGSSTTPPVVRFTWYVDVGGVAAPQTADVTLDTANPAGKLVTIADGVEVVFGAGNLTAGDSLNMIVDGDPDQANLLGALGMNTLLSGDRASTFAVADAIRQDPSRLAVGQTRVAGDNSNVLSLLSLRRQTILDNGTSTTDDFVASLAANVGSQVDLARRLGENQAILKETLENRRDSVSGVNLDEEVGALIQQQQAYAAAARIITTIQENIRTLLELIN